MSHDIITNGNVPDADSHARVRLQRAGSAFRLLNEEDVICATDERLCDDCQTWETLECDTWAAGMRYNSTVFVPMRRALTQNDEAHRPDSVTRTPETK